VTRIIRGRWQYAVAGRASVGHICFHVINRDNTQIEVFLKDDKPAWTGFWIAITWISYTDVITSRTLKKASCRLLKRSRGETRENRRAEAYLQYDRLCENSKGSNFFISG
jgi:hypothetical protein